MSDGDFTNPFGTAAAGSGFEVYPQALRAATDDVFAALVTAINGLFAQAVSTLGDFRAQATALVQGDTDFPDLPPMPANSGMDNEKQWRIDPTAAPA